MKSFFLTNPKNMTIFLSLCAIGLITLIYIQSSYPPLAILGEYPGLDKIGHFVLYGILGGIFYQLLFRLINIKPFPASIIVIILVTTFGLFDELHQSYIPSRNANVWDLLADFLGGCFSICLCTANSPAAAHHDEDYPDNKNN